MKAIACISARSSGLMIALLSFLLSACNTINQGRVDAIQELIAQNKLEEARSAANVLFRDAEQSPEFRAWACVKRGDIELRQHRRAMAVAQFELAIETAGEKFPAPANTARLRLAQSFAQGWQPAAAIAQCETIIRSNSAVKPTSKQVAWALFWKATALRNQAKDHEAIECLRQALPLADTKDAEQGYHIEFALGELCRPSRQPGLTADVLTSGQSEEAIKHFIAALNTAIDGNLSEEKQDRARIATARAMSVAGRKDQAIGWLRAGIADPKALRDSERSLALQLSQCLSPDDAEQWHLFLADPTHSNDPTGGAIKATFGDRPSRVASSSIQGNRWNGMYLLAQFYQRCERHNDAVTRYEGALQAAQTDEQSAATYSGLVSEYLAVATVADREGHTERSVQAKREAAERGAIAWKSVIKDRRGDSSHDPVTQGYFIYVRMNDTGKTVQFIKDLLGDPKLKDDPSKHAFVRYWLMEAWASSHLFDRAVETAEGLYHDFQDRPEDDIREVCDITLQKAAQYASMSSRSKDKVDWFNAEFRRRSGERADMPRQCFVR